MGSYTYANLQTRVSAEIADSANSSVTLAQVKQAIISAIEHYERERTWFNEHVSTALVTVANFPAVAVPSDLLFIDTLQSCTTGTITGTTTTSASTITGCSATSSLSAGMPITGTGIPAASYIKSVDSSTQITMCDIYGTVALATATGSITLTYYSLNRMPVAPITYSQWAGTYYGATGASWPSQYAYYQDRILLGPAPNTVYGLVMSYVRRLTTLSADSDNNGWTNFCEPLIRSRAKWLLFNNLLYLPKMAQISKQEELDTLLMLDEEREQRLTGKTTACYL